MSQALTKETVLSLERNFICISWVCKWEWLEWTRRGRTWHFQTIYPFISIPNLLRPQDHTTYNSAGKLLYRAVTINCPCDGNKIITLGLCGMNEIHKMIIIAEFSINHLRLTWLERRTSLWFWNPPTEIWVSSQQLMANQTGYSFEVTTNISGDKRCLATQRISEISIQRMTIGWLTERQSPPNYRN